MSQNRRAIGDTTRTSSGHLISTMARASYDAARRSSVAVRSEMWAAFVLFVFHRYQIRLPPVSGTSALSCTRKERPAYRGGIYGERALMCGIVGYVGPREATDVVISGLQRLEYRGYDSAGIAIVHRDDIAIRRSVGKLARLKTQFHEKPARGHQGIGHTRWAT